MWKFLLQKASFVQTVKLGDRNSYARLTTPPNLGNIGQTGEPVLPVKHFKILIPPNALATNVKCKVSGKQVMSLPNKTEHGQHPIPTSLNYKKKEFVPPNPEIYNTRQPYPGKKAEIISQGSFRGNRIVTVALYPYQYLPKAKQIMPK